MAVGVAGPVQPHVWIQYTHRNTHSVSAVLSWETRKERKRKKNNERRNWSEAKNEIAYLLLLSTHMCSFTIATRIMWLVRILTQLAFSCVRQFYTIHESNRVELFSFFVYFFFLRFVHFVSIKNCRRQFSARQCCMKLNGVELREMRMKNELVIRWQSTFFFFRSTCSRFRWYKNSFYDIISIFSGFTVSTATECVLLQWC